MNNNDNWTNLVMAAHNGDADFIKASITSGLDINAKNVHGESLLMTTIRYGSSNGVKTLSKCGADLNSNQYLFPQTSQPHFGT